MPPGVARLVLPGEALGAARARCGCGAAPRPSTERAAWAPWPCSSTCCTGGRERRPAAPPPSPASPGLDVGRSFALAEARTDIGRGEQAPRAPAGHRAVSRAHARMRRQDEALPAWRTWAAPTALYLNGHRLAAPPCSTDGDVLELGQTLLRFQAPLRSPRRSRPLPRRARNRADGRPLERPRALRATRPPRRPRVRWEGWLHRPRGGARPGGAARHLRPGAG